MLDILGTAKVGRYNDCYFYSYKPLGLSLCSERDRLKAIFLYAEGAYEYRQYRGKLPEQLSWKLSRYEIEKRLGPPDAAGGEGVIQFWVSYHGQQFPQPL
jgi:hypothetical protein